MLAGRPPGSPAPTPSEVQRFVNGTSALVFYALIILAFYFLLIRPQRRRQRELTSTRSALEPGAEVMLTSGIYGRVVSLEEETIHLEVAPGSVLKVARAAVVRVVEPAPIGEHDQPDDPDALDEEPGDGLDEDTAPRNGSERSE